MTNQQYLVQQIVIILTFIICMYFSFAYSSTIAGFGAVIAFFNIGNKIEK